MRNSSALALAAGVMIFLSVLSTANALAFHYIVGQVNDAGDATPADGRSVRVYRESNPSDFVSGIIGSSVPNIYMDLNCKLLTPACGIGEILLVQVPDAGDGYFTEPVEVIVSSAGWTQAPDMTLVTEECPNTGYVLIVTTDKSSYDPGETVEISGNYEDQSCDPVQGKELALEIEDPNAVKDPYQVTTDENGEYLQLYDIPSDAKQGVYTVYASNGNGKTESITFIVGDDNDGDGYYADVDCNDNDASINPGASETCNSKDDNCNGQIDEGGVCQEASGGGGGYTSTRKAICGDNECQTTESCSSCPEDCGECPEPPESPECEENWVCSEWSECQEDNTRTRTCVDAADCGTEEMKPKETESCVYLPGETPGTEGPGSELPPTGLFSGLGAMALGIVLLIAIGLGLLLYFGFRKS